LSETATWTPEHLGVGEFTRLFAQSRERYGAVFDIATPDIAAFVGAGGRTIIWHGLADPLPVAGSVRYVNEVRQELGSRRTNASLRLYLAPGVGHCAGGDGPQPIGLLGALIKWVELGQAPGALMSENRGDSGEVTRTRPLCPYPTRARYRGRGSIDDAANFSCRP
jgi:Tannase and feruloyl esterase.